MKKTYIFAFMALTILIVPSMAAAAAECRACYGQPDLSAVCPDCRAPAWNRTQCEIGMPCYTCPPTVIMVDPWVRCGAFCAAGQISPGWPYGWNASYWLRPDTNY